MNTQIGEYTYLAGPGKCEHLALVGSVLSNTSVPNNVCKIWEQVNSLWNRKYTNQAILLIIQLVISLGTVVQQKNQKRKTKDKNNEKSRGFVTLPYVQGVAEPVQCILKHQEIATAVRPHRNLRNILVHPKDKVEDRSNTDCVYQIPWNIYDVSRSVNSSEHLAQEKWIWTNALVLLYFKSKDIKIRLAITWQTYKKQSKQYKSTQPNKLKLWQFSDIAHSFLLYGCEYFITM